MRKEILFVTVLFNKDEDKNFLSIGINIFLMFRIRGFKKI